MRIWILVFTLVLGAALTGCAAAQTFETVADAYIQEVAAQHRAVSVTLPKEASTPVAQGEDGTLYICGAYELWVQTLPGGDVARTVKTVSGFDPAELTVMEQRTEEGRRYDFVWTAAGESGARIGRAAVLDDGNYHYVLTAMCSALDAGNVRSDWDMVFQSFSLS